MLTLRTDEIPRLLSEVVRLRYENSTMTATMTAENRAVSAENLSLVDQIRAVKDENRALKMSKAKVNSF